MCPEATEGQNHSLEELATRYLFSLPESERAGNGQEINRFLFWFGRERRVAELSIPEVAKYAEQISATDPLRNLEPVRAFLQYAKKEKLTSSNLAAHLRVKKAPTKPEGLGKKPPRQAQSLSPEGYAKLEAELAALKGERSRLAEELHLAAADKDFRENAPLEAVREEKGRQEARIRELDSILQSAIIDTGERRELSKIVTGHTVIIRDLDSDTELRYTLVNPSEVNPMQGKISIASPMGKALLGRGEGEVIEVTAPVGMFHYLIERVEA